MGRQAGAWGQVILPRTNENGYYEMRLESIGGLGANLCGKLLGELGAACLGLNAAAFSSYGSPYLDVEGQGILGGPTTPVRALSIP